MLASLQWSSGFVTGTRQQLAVLLFCLPFQMSEHVRMSKEIKMGSLLTVLMLSHTLYIA